MKSMNWLTFLAFVGMLAQLPSCALLTKNAPIQPRYFSPDLSPAGEAIAVSATSGEGRLRLGRVLSGAHLRERMVYRTSSEEMGFYDRRRWTERPEVYLRRALSQALFESGGLTRAVSGSAPHLDAELTAFEEIRGDEHRVRVQIVMKLDGVLGGSLTETVTVEREVAGSDHEEPAPVVRALAAALAEAVGRIQQEVLAQLALMPSRDAAEIPGAPSAP